MAELKLKILMDAVERVSAPFKRATQSTDQMKVALKGATDAVRTLEKAQSGIEAFGRLKEQARANASALAAAQTSAQAMGRELAAAGNDTKKARAAFNAARREVEGLKGDVDASATALAAAQEKALALEQELAAMAGVSKKAQAAFSAARREVNRLEEAQTSIIRETSILRTKLGESGIDTKNLAAAQRQLKRDLDAARTAAARQATALDNARAKTEALAKARAKLQGAQDMQGKLAMNGAVGMATGGGILAAGAPIVTTAGDFEHQLAAYGLTAGQAGEQLAVVRDRLRELSAQINVSASDMLEGQAIMVGKGLKPDDALAAIGTIGRAVTGTGAEMADMASLAYSVMDNLKVPQAELARAFDIMAKAGDEGGFELRDMATYFPMLTSSAYQLGMTGNKAIGSLAAALQIATKGAADTSEAANNMANFLKAFTGKEAVKNFEEKGIDIKAALQKGLMDGKDPIETMLSLVGQGIGVDLQKEVSDAMASGLDPKAAAERVAGRFNLAELFGDAQAQNFIAPMLANMAEYRRIRDATMNSDGTVDQKFAVMMSTFNEATKGLGIDMKNTWEGIGNTMLPVLIPMVNGLRSALQGVNAFATANPNLTRTLVIAAGAIGLLIAAGGAVSLAMASVLGPFAMARFALTAIGLQSGFAAGGMGLLGSVGSTALGLLTTGIRAVGMAFLMNPIGLAITAIIAGLTALYFAWEPFQKLVDNVFDKIKGIFGFGDKKPPELTEVTEKTKTIAPAPTTMKVVGTAAAAATVAAPLAAMPAPAAPVDMGGVTIVVNAAPGQSVDEIAKEVRRQLDLREQQARTAARGRLYDGEK